MRPILATTGTGSSRPSVSSRRPNLLLFFFNAPPTTEIYSLSLHDALPISHEISEPVLRTAREQKDRAQRYALGRPLSVLSRCLGALRARVLPVYRAESGPGRHGFASRRISLVKLCRQQPGPIGSYDRPAPRLCQPCRENRTPPARVWRAPERAPRRRARRGISEGDTGWLCRGQPAPGARSASQENGVCPCF